MKKNLFSYLIIPHKRKEKRSRGGEGEGRRKELGTSAIRPVLKNANEGQRSCKQLHGSAVFAALYTRV